MNGPVTICGIAGSLRRLSFNRGLLRAAAEVAPPVARVEIAAIDEVPLYNQDVQDKGFPPPVRELAEKVRAADALLLVSPEYNYSVPGVLKNAIDWLSRMPEILKHKPVAVIGASPGGFGTVRAQTAWRPVFTFTDSYLMAKPELMVSKAGEKFDASANLTDAATRESLKQLVAALASWARRLSAQGVATS